MMWRASLRFQRQTILFRFYTLLAFLFALAIALLAACWLAVR